MLGVKLGRKATEQLCGPLDTLMLPTPGVQKSWAQSLQICAIEFRNVSCFETAYVWDILFAFWLLRP